MYVAHLPKDEVEEMFSEAPTQETISVCQMEINHLGYYNGWFTNHRTNPKYNFTHRNKVSR